MGTQPRRGRRDPAGLVTLSRSMCSAIQPSSRAMTEAMRSANDFFARMALPP